MTMPGVSCKAVATQNSSEWPCSMCPFPQLRLVGVRTSYIFFSNISWTPWVLDPITNPFLGPSSWLHPVSTLHGKSQNASFLPCYQICPLPAYSMPSKNFQPFHSYVYWLNRNFLYSRAKEKDIYPEKEDGFPSFGFFTIKATLASF